VLVAVFGDAGRERRETHLVGRARDDALAGLDAGPDERPVAVGAAEGELALLEPTADAGITTPSIVCPVPTATWAVMPIFSVPSGLVTS
jgi:hypothetical protein